jgi:hypothetical protein
MTNPTPTPNAQLYGAVAKAISACRPVEKASRNDYHRYKYASAEDVMASARVALSDNGLSLIPVSASFVRDNEGGLRAYPYDQAGKKLISYMANFAWMLTHASGECMPLGLEWPVEPEKGRPLNKALAASSTTALSYLLRDLLLIPRVDEEVDMHPRGGGGGSRAQGRPPEPRGGGRPPQDRPRPDSGRQAAQPAAPAQPPVDPAVRAKRASMLGWVRKASAEVTEDLSSGEQIDRAKGAFFLEVNRLAQKTVFSKDGASWVLNGANLTPEGVTRILGDKEGILTRAKANVDEALAEAGPRA